MMVAMTFLTTASMVLAFQKVQAGTHDPDEPLFYIGRENAALAYIRFLHWGSHTCAEWRVSNCVTPTHHPEK